MKRLVVLTVLAAWPVQAQEGPKSEAGTQFLQRCLKDITDNRIATLKRQAPDYAATLSDEELQEGGMRTAKKTCPCFLQVIAVDVSVPDQSPEEKVRHFVDYLDALGTDEALPMPPTIPKLTRLCGVRSAILPQSWVPR